MKMFKYSAEFLGGVSIIQECAIEILSVICPLMLRKLTKNRDNLENANALNSALYRALRQVTATRIKWRRYFEPRNPLNEKPLNHAVCRQCRQRGIFMRSAFCAPFVRRSIAEHIDKRRKIA